jgi:hypothetical protein
MKNVVVNEISLLKRGTRPAVPKAIIGLAKNAEPRPAAFAPPPPPPAPVTELQKAAAAGDIMKRLEDSLMEKRDIDRATATAWLSKNSAEYRQFYAEQKFAKTMHAAKSSTFLRKANASTATNAAPDREAVVAANEQLDQMAKDLVAKTNVNFYAAYAQVTQTPDGARLFRIAAGAPSLAGRNP